VTINVYKETTEGVYVYQTDISQNKNTSVSADTSDYVWVLVEANGANPYVSMIIYNDYSR
jgi:hypothetical protein